MDDYGFKPNFSNLNQKQQKFPYNSFQSINQFPLTRETFFTQKLPKMNQNTTFDLFINGLLNEKKFRNSLKDGTEQYDILRYKVLNLTAQDIKKMYYKIVEKYEDLKNQKSGQGEDIQSEENSWMINELKIFVWVAVCYAAQVEQHLSALNLEAWNFLVSVFYFKPREILQFQLLSLLRGEPISSPRKWSNSQNELLKQILRNPQLEGKWNEISKLFFLKSNKKYFRKPQKCREHWNNHLNPVISHEPWSPEEDIEMVEHVIQVGKKWSEISMLLGGHRTEHMVKNRYKSLEKKFQAEIMLTQKKQLQPYMLKKTAEPIEQQMPAIDLSKTQSTKTQAFQKIEMIISLKMPANIQQSSVDNDNHERENEFNINFMNTEPNMIEISEEKFFLKTKRSLGLMSEMDEEIQMYVESFLF